MGDSPNREGVERRDGGKGRRDSSNDRRGLDRVETEPESRRKRRIGVRVSSAAPSPHRAF